MAMVTIYQKPTCSTCRQAVQLLKESGKPFTAINYYEKPFTKAATQEPFKEGGSLTEGYSENQRGHLQGARFSEKESFG